MEQKIKGNVDNKIKVFCRFNKENAPISEVIKKIFKDFLNDKNISKNN